MTSVQSHEVRQPNRSYVAWSRAQMPLDAMIVRRPASGIARD